MSDDVWSREVWADGKERVVRRCVHRQAEPVVLSNGEHVACICIKCWDQLPDTYIAGQRAKAEREAYCTHEDTMDFTQFGQIPGSQIQCVRCGAMLDPA